MYLAPSRTGTFADPVPLFRPARERGSGWDGYLKPRWLYAIARHAPPRYNLEPAHKQEVFKHKILIHLRSPTHFNSE